MHELVEEMKLHGVEPTEYTGPSSIHSFILSECEMSGARAISVWGHAPEYVRDADSRTAHHSYKVRAILGIEVDLEDLRRQGDLLRRKMDEAMSKGEAFSQLVRKLEVDYNISRRKPDYIA